MALEIRLDVADALRLAAERLGRMQIGVVVELVNGSSATPRRLQ